METKQNKKEVTRERNQQLILSAAEKVFAQLGYDGASMSMIAKEANVPKANVHYYFNSKEGLYEAVLDNIVSSWNSGLEDVTVDDDPAIALHRYIKYKIISSIENPIQSKLFTSEITRGAPYLQEYLRKNTRPWFRQKCQLLQDWIDAGKIEKVEPSYLLFTIWSSTQYFAVCQTEALLLMNKHEYEDSDIVNITQTISQLILKGLGLTIPS